MSIAVIIPAYNSERYLRYTLDSILAQTIEDWQLIVVDDGSSDDTIEIVSEYVRRDSRIRLIQQQNGGVAAARNRGIAELPPDASLVALIDHDDVWMPDALEVLLQALADHPECSAAHGLARFIDEQGNACYPGEAENWTRERRGVIGNQVVQWPLDAPTTFEVQALWNHILTPGQVLIRSSALLQAGSFDPVTVPCDDWDMWIRLSWLGGLAFVDRVVLGFRQHAANASHDRRRMSEADHIVRRKYLSWPGLLPEQREIIRRGFRFFERESSKYRLRWAREALTKGQLIGAAKQVRHAVKSYARSFSDFSEKSADGGK